MCGIAGLLLTDRHAAVSAERLDVMVDALAHRGPDDRGVHIDGPIGIGMRRLSIIDVEGGRQPIANEDESVWVVYNGECYNFQELREELVAAGHRFATRTDTEVIVHGYEEWGPRGLAGRLNGIYAFCVWDTRRRVAYLVRDRLGVKPLYFVSRASGLAFASEIRSLARSGLCLPKIDEEAVWSYLLYQYTPSERTPLAGVVRLPAGHILEWRAETGRVEVDRYWDFPPGGERGGVSLDEAAAELGELLDDTVRRQMIADVPIGCFLSGGLDSTIVAALIARHSSQPVRTFSIGFPSFGAFDETPYAERVARAIGAEHVTVPFEEAAFVEHIDDYLARVDEPVADAAMLPTYALSQVAAREVKVVLTGEGADEVFGGYAYYRRFLHGGPAAAPGGAERLRGLAALRGVLGEHLGRAFPAPATDLSSPHSGFPYIAQPEFLWCLLDGDRRPSLETFKRVLASTEERLLPATETHTPLQRALYLDTKLWLGHDLMNKLDKSTMAHGLEGRVPFLDHRLVEFAFTLPDRFKVGPERGKLVLREAVRDLIPGEILEREKKGFGVPIDDWFRGALREFAREALLDASLVREGLLAREAMEAVLHAHCALGVNLGRMIWTLVNLDRWWRRIRAEIVHALPERGAIPTVAAERAPSVEVIIPVHENLSLVRDCVRSLLAFTRHPFTAILVDDASTPATGARLRRLVDSDARLRLVRTPRNLGFLGACRQGFALARADYVVLLNSDTVVAPGWLERMVACAESDPSIAVVNPLTNESGNTSVRLAPGLNLLTQARRVAELARPDYPDITTGVGMCMLVRRSAVELLGGFDPVFAPAYCEESDLCMRLTEAGLRVVAAEDAFIYHKGWASYDDVKKNALYERNRAEFDRRWAVAYERDWMRYERHDPLQYVRDGLLWGTLRPEEADPDQRASVEHRLARLETREALAASGQGRSASAATALLAGRAAPRGEATFREWGVERHQRPLLRFEARAVAMPTRHYVARLPAPDPRKLRVTFLVSNLPLAGGVISIAQVARELMLAGHEVKIATEAHEIVPEMLNIWAQPLIYRDRAHLIEAFPESDVVVATFWTTAHRYMRELRRRYSFVSVYYVQDFESLFHPEAEYENRRAAIRSYGETERHVLASRWIGDMIGDRIPPAPIVPLGLDLGVFYPRGNKPPRPRVVAVAFPEPSKRHRRGFFETIEAFRRIHEARPDVELVFYGADPPEMPDMPFPYTNAGRIYNHDKVAELVSSSHVLLDASLWQGFGRPGLEAMACATVPVMTDVGGIHEYARDGENCLLFPSGDAGAAAGAVLRLLDDSALYARTAAAGLRTAPPFSHEIIGARHLSLYQQWFDEKFPGRLERRARGRCTHDGANSRVAT